MAKDHKINMPLSGGGLVRYFDEYKSRLSFSPKVVFAMVVIVVVLEIFLHHFKPWG